jgi:hypothetical protein
MTAMAEPKNYAFHSIAAAWALNLIPHTYFFLKFKSVAGSSYSNILSAPTEAYSFLLLIPDR